MKKRMFLMLTAAAVFITAIGAVKYGQIKKGMAQHAAFKMPPEAVTTVIAKPVDWPATLSSIGSVAAVRGVVVSSDLPGIVEKIAFESGKAVREGDLLVQLDTRQEQAQLAAARAQNDLAKVSLDRLTGLRQKGIAAPGGVRTTPTPSGSRPRRGSARSRRRSRARPSARRSRAMLGIRQVNLGQYLHERQSDRAAAGARPDLRQLLGAAAGGGAPDARRHGACCGRGRQARGDGQGHRGQLGDRRRHPQRPDPGDVCQSRRQAEARACS